MDRNLTAEEIYGLYIQDPGRFEKMILDDDSSFIKETVSERLKSLMKKHKKKASEVIGRSLLSKSYFYQVLQGERQPSREALIRIGIVCDCSAEEIQRLLLLAGAGVLYTKLRRDAAILLCIDRKMNLYETDEFLSEIGEKGLL